MFGYITVDPTHLSQEGQERYRHWYCGLCQSLYERLGQMGRAVLSNDLTFLCILLSSVYEPEQRDDTRLCPVHPLKKRQIRRTSMTEYCADMNLLLAYYKCLDNERDEKRSGQKRLCRILEKETVRLRDIYPEKDRIIQDTLEKIHHLEDAESQDVDLLCRLSGEMLGEVFAFRNDIFAPLFRRAGHALGQFVYLSDAWEDYDEDMKKGRFNPLRQFHDQPGYEDTVFDAMSGMLGEAVAAVRLLPVEQDLDLVEHVLFKGVFYRYNLCMQKRLKKNEKPEDSSDQCTEKGAEAL